MTWTFRAAPEVSPVGPDAATFVPLATAGDWSAVFVTVLAALFLVAVAFVILLNRFQRDDMDATHAGVILSQLRTFGGSRGAVVVRDLEQVDDPQTLDEIRNQFHGERSDDPTARSATVEIVREVLDEIRGRSPDTTSVPARAVEEAVLTAIMGAIAIVPIAAWQDAASAGGMALPDLQDILHAGVTVADLGLGAITAFPYTDMLFALAVTAGVLGANTIWTLWFLPPAVLTALAATYYYLDHRIATDWDPSGPSTIGWARRILTLVVLTWAIGTILATIGGLFPGQVIRIVFAAALTALVLGLYLFVYPVRPNWKHAAFLATLPLGIGHPSLAAVAAAAVAGRTIAIWTRRTLRRWRQAASEHGRDALALDIIHSLTVTAGALTLPLLAGYAIAALATGKILRVGAVVLDAPSQTVLAVGLLATVTALTIAVVLLDRFRGVRRGIRRALTIQSVRTVLFARAFPVLVSVVIAALLLGLGFPVVGVVAAALAIGILARFVYMAFNYLTYRYETREGRDGTASRVVINGRVVHDRDEKPVYVADVNGHRTAHRRLDPLIGQIRRDTRALFEDGAPESGSFPHYYWKHGVRRGKVDMNAVADELLGDVRTRFRANVKQTDASAEDIMEKLRDEYPPHVVHRVVQTLKDRGRVTRREDTFQWLGGPNR